MSDRPNILCYCTDQQRFDTICGLGNTNIHTPRLDSLMKDSMAFTKAYCQSPICTPSRASFLTGMYPSAVSVNGNGIPTFPKYYEDRLISHQLAESGYDCGLVGKLHLACAAYGQEPRVNDGFRYFAYSHSHNGPNDYGHEYAEWLRKKGVDPEKLLNECVSPNVYREEGAMCKKFGGVLEPSEDNDNVPPHLHQTFWCTEKAIEFIQKNRHSDQPWFLFVNPFDPHASFNPPWEYYKRYVPEALPGAHFRESDLAHQQILDDAGVDFQSKPRHPEDLEHRKVQAAYYAMIEQIDHEFGRLLDFLESTGGRENTIIIFTSDHGEALCDHGLILKGCRFYEGSIRVPLMISWPKGYQVDTVSDALVELTDLAPTLYEAAGLETPYYVQGKSLTQLLKGKTGKHREYVRAEFFGAIDYPDQTHATMYRDERWKLICYHNKNLCELYNLENDPWEHEDLSGRPEFQDIKWSLLQKSFDATARAYARGPSRVASF